MQTWTFPSAPVLLAVLIGVGGVVALLVDRLVIRGGLAAMKTSGPAEGAGTLPPRRLPILPGFSTKRNGDFKPRADQPYLRAEGRE